MSVWIKNHDCYRLPIQPWKARGEGWKQAEMRKFCTYTRILRHSTNTSGGEDMDGCSPHFHSADTRASNLNNRCIRKSKATNKIPLGVLYEICDFNLFLGEKCDPSGWPPCKEDAVANSLNYTSESGLWFRSSSQSVSPLRTSIIMPMRQIVPLNPRIFGIISPLSAGLCHTSSIFLWDKICLESLFQILKRSW